MTGKLVIGIVFLLLALAGALGFCWPFGESEPVLQLHGTVETQEVRLGSRIGGRVDKVAVAEGDLIQPGQPLVWFEAQEWQARRDQLQAQLEAGKAQLAKAKAGNRDQEKAAAAAAVAAAAARWQRLDAGYRPEEIEQARKELESLQAELEHAQHELDRERTLATTKASARSFYDTALATHRRLQSQVQAAQSRLKMLEDGYRLEEIAEALAELERVRANEQLILAGTRDEEIVEAEAKVAELAARLREAEVNLREAVIHAPERAVVEVVAVRKGDLVPPHQPVLRVLRIDDLWVKAYVPEVELGKVRLNQPCEVAVDAYPGRRFQGTVVHIAAVSEFTPRNVQSLDERRHQVFGIKIRVADPEGVFKSGMAAEIYLPLSQ